MAGPFECMTCGRSFVPYSRGRHVYCKRCRDKADRSVGSAIRAKCKECGRAFTAASRRQRFCSGECRLEGRRRRAREYHRRELADPRNRVIAAARARASIARRRDRAGGGGGDGERRRPAGRGAAGRTSNGAPSRSIPCGLCGRSFAQSGRGYRVYCNQCRARADKSIAKVRSVKCGECGREFVAASHMSRYCSHECRTAAIRRTNRELYSRRMADPVERARIAARSRAQLADKKAMKK